MDMDQETLRIIKERFPMLPKSARGALLSDDFQQNVRMIGARFNLTETQSEALETEIFITLLGFSTEEELSSNIQKAAQVPAPSAVQIAAELRKQLATPLQELQHHASKDTQAPAPETKEAPVVIDKPLRASESKTRLINPEPSDPYREIIE